jgi:hypothetical protein
MENQALVAREVRRTDPVTVRRAIPRAVIRMAAHIVKLLSPIALGPQQKPSIVVSRDEDAAGLNFEQAVHQRRRVRGDRVGGGGQRHRLTWACPFLCSSSCMF